MPVSRKIQASFARSSWVRKMFEEGLRLKAQFGRDNVYDFSLGNPDLEPPAAFRQALKDLAADTQPGRHAYMPNAGYPETRQRIADWMSALHGVSFSGEDVLMTVGAAGALNITMKTLLDPGDEIVIPRPYFLEYASYIDNYGGMARAADTRPDFSLDLDAIAAGLNEHSRFVLINSPNNPTGRIYDRAQIEGLADLLRDASDRLGRPIYLVSDEPYRRIAYDGVEVPSIFSVYRDSIVVTSFSKDLSVPGERIGFVAVHPELTDRPEVLAGLALCIRSLGYVNAPAFMQRAVIRALDAQVDVEVYRRRRDLFCDALASFGYEFVRPEGAFYIFPRSPLPDDVAFVGLLQEERVLVTPGVAFDGVGHFRIAYCVDDRTIEAALPGFEKVIKKVRGGTG
jgi:aspartate aminotransferase